MATLTLTPDYTRITFTWSDLWATGVSYVEVSIYKGSSTNGTAIRTTTTYQHTTSGDYATYTGLLNNLEEGTQYTVLVVAYNSAGEWSGQDYATTTTKQDIQTTYTVSYVVTFELNGGDANGNRWFEKSDTSTRTYATIIGNTIYPPTRTGYKFIGWTAVEKDGTEYWWGTDGKSFEPPLTAYSDGHRYTFTAHWQQITYTVSYTVSYNAGGGTWPNGTPNAYSNSFISTQTSVGNQTATVPSTKPTRTDYSFTGWILKDNASGDTRNYVSSTTQLTGLTAIYGGHSYTLTAQWQHDLYIRIDYSIDADASWDTAPQPIVKTYATTQSELTNQSIKISNLVPKRPGYKFLHWLVKNTTYIWSPGDTLTGLKATYPANTYVLVAQWKKAGATVWIYTGTKEGWQQATPWIYNGTQWVEALPYIYDSGEWKPK